MKTYPSFRRTFIADSSLIVALAVTSTTINVLAAGLPDAGFQRSDNWMLVFPAGVSVARDGRGPFITGDINGLQAIIDRTLKLAGTTEVMVDYDHQLHHSAVPGVGGTAMAAGWIKEWSAKPSGIWARIEWTDAAAAKIKAREYRYLSPLFTSDKDGNVDEILNIGLVNRPALDRLEAIAAQTSHTPLETKTMEAILKALGLDAKATEANALTAIAALTATATTALTALDLKPDADNDAIKAAVTALSGNADGLKVVALAAGLDEKADAKTIAAAVTAANADDSGKVIAGLQAELTKNATALATLQGGISTDKATAFVDAAIKQGRVGVKPLRDHYIKRHAASAEGATQVEAELAALPMLNDSGTQIAPPVAADGTIALSASHKAVAHALGLDEKAYAETLKAEQAA